MFNRKYIFTQQSLFSCKLKGDYLPENFSADLFKIHNLSDADGNPIALYKDDYLHFKQKANEQYPNTDLSLLAKDQITKILENSNLKVIKYFNARALNDCQLEVKEFNETGELTTISGIRLKKNQHQNCVVMKDGKIYAHPKVRSNPRERIIGVSHSSFTGGNPVEFAGSFVYSRELGWVIENTSGHYGPRAVQMRNFIQALKNEGMDLGKLTVKLWIPNDLKNCSANESDYRILQEDAEQFLKRMTLHRSHSNSDTHSDLSDSKEDLSGNRSPFSFSK